MTKPRALGLAGVFMGLVLLAAACDSGRQNGGPLTENVARLVCGDGTTALTQRVQAGREGIDIELDNRINATQFYIRSAADLGENHGGHLRPGITEITTTMPPGEVWIGCFERARDVPETENVPEFAKLTIVDPENLWIPPELDCEGEERASRLVAGSDVSEDVEGVIRSTVPGVRPVDEIVRPGYPETQWHSEVRQLVRRGRAVANVSVFAQRGHWHLSVRRCPNLQLG